MQYINFNGTLCNAIEALLPVTNRAFTYGDGFFESMVMFNGKLPLLQYHWQRIVSSTHAISALLPTTFTIDYLQQQILELSNRNGSITNARIRLQFYRTGSGLYLPDSDELGFVISITPLKNHQFEAGDGLIAGLYNAEVKSLSTISGLKTSSALNYVLAAKHAKVNGWNECILTNHSTQICEGLSTNIFIVKNGLLTTPPLSSGCVQGVMRSYLLSHQQAEEREIEIPELLNAGEILMTNAVKGIQWVKQLNGKVYSNTAALKLCEWLNSKLLA